MSAFEFFFSFYGLLLGLSVAEVITGLMRVFKLRRKVRIGWLTPMLGVVVLMDIASFWTMAWGNMQAMSVSYRLLFAGLLTAGVYFAAASMVTPDDPAEWPEFDAFYDSHKRYVLGGVMLANILAGQALVMILHGMPAWLELWQTPVSLFSIVSFNLLLLALMLVRDRRINVALLALLIAMYGVTAIYN